jgi:hypothetical protein
MGAIPLSVPRIDPTAAAALRNLERMPARHPPHTARTSYEAARRHRRRGTEPLTVTLADHIRARYLTA